LRPIRSAAAVATRLEGIGSGMRRHKALTRVALAALVLTLLVVSTQQASTQAGPEAAPAVRESLLPLNVGAGIPTDGSVTVPFDAPMDPASVEPALDIIPSQPVELAWNAERTALALAAPGGWRTDERYVVVVPASSRTQDGTPIGAARRFSFTTQAAPVVTDFQVRLAEEDTSVLTPPPAAGAEAVVVDGDRAAKMAAATEASTDRGERLPSQTATEVSATSSITVSFSGAMDTADVEEHFTISPSVAGDLAWRGRDLVFTPTERLAAGGRYTVSLIGAHDAAGNLLGGKANFSFLVQPGARVTRTTPESGATDVDAATVEAWFSQPMNVEAAGVAFSVTQAATGQRVAGTVEWNEAATQLTFVPEAAFAPGTTFEVAFGDGATDADGNAVDMAWSFTTTVAVAHDVVTATPTPAPAASAPVAAQPAPAPAPAPVVPPAAPASTAAGYAVNQINASRAAYGFGPVVLDDAISAVAYAHAYWQATVGTLSHIGPDGSTREVRLQRGGISFGWSAENQCYLIGRSIEATLDWCHAQFMAEPYPGQWNHIANVLSPNARRVGVGIAQVGSRVVIVWNFTD